MKIKKSVCAPNPPRRMPEPYTVATRRYVPLVANCVLAVGRRTKFYSGARFAFTSPMIKTTSEAINKTGPREINSKLSPLIAVVSSATELSKTLVNR